MLGTVSRSGVEFPASEAETRFLRGAIAGVWIPLNVPRGPHLYGNAPRGWLMHLATTITCDRHSFFSRLVRGRRPRALNADERR